MIVLEIFIAILLIKVIVYTIIEYSNKMDVHFPVHTLPEWPRVDIIVPMYNEETVIIKTINNFLNIDYEKFRIIIIDDGSTDNSLEIVRANFSGHEKVKILYQQNQGKAIALNSAINFSDSEFVICIDADTIVGPNIMQKILPYFSDKDVAAVSGYIKVGNKNNNITTIQYLEYITNQNCERSVFESINGILIVPGAIGAFRKSVIMSLGGYVSDTLTEDTDITLRIISENYTIRNAPEAIGYTEAPATTKMFFKQRVRWKVGIVQCLMKYSKRLFNHSNKTLLYIIMPYTWFYCVFLPLFTPLVDYVLIYNCLFNRFNIQPLIKCYLLFILIDFIIALFVLLKSKEKRINIVELIYQRFLLRHLTFLVYFNILWKFLNGDLFKWNKVTRYGNVSLEPVD